jgi:glycosyltransferase involved in cell wall biosynthesis
MPFFSVVIPTYNRREMLREALASIWSQTFSDYEVIVVDDGSTDGTQESLISQNAPFRFLTQSHRGPGAARNLGIGEAQGEYLAFLDSDDLWFPWTLETYASVIREQGAPAFLTGMPFYFRDKTELSGVTKSALAINSFPDYLASSAEFRGWGVSSFVIRVDAIRACGGFMEANLNCEDLDLALKLGVAKGFIQITSPATFGYRSHGANVTSDLMKTVEGEWHQVHTEAAGGYPGGGQRQLERWRILSRHVRPVALECLRTGRRNEAWKLHRATFHWHWRLSRWKYILGFPLFALLFALRVRDGTESRFAK